MLKHVYLWPKEQTKNKCQFNYLAHKMHNTMTAEDKEKNEFYRNMSPQDGKISHQSKLGGCFIVCGAEEGTQPCTAVPKSDPGHLQLTPEDS